MKKLLLKIVRLPFLGNLVGWCIAHLAHALPLKIVAENERCIAFHHPAPSYEIHLLVMLKEQIRDISCISASRLKDVLSIAEAAVVKLGLSAPHIMLWTNAERFQDVRQLHFHLFPSDLDREADIRKARTVSFGGIEIRECTRGNGVESNLLIIDSGLENFISLLPLIMDRYQLHSRGYSVFWDLSEQAARKDRIYIRMG